MDAESLKRLVQELADKEAVALLWAHTQTPGTEPDFYTLLEAGTA